MRRLLIRPGAIGDSILCLPAMEFLKAEYTEVWTARAVTPLFEGSFDCVRAISSTGLDTFCLPGLEPEPELAAYLRTFNSIVSWYGANRPEFRECVRELRLPCEFLSALPGSNEREHAADFFLKQVGGSGRALPRLTFGPSAPREEAVIHPFSSSAKKNWKLAKYCELAGRLPIPVAWVAGPEDALEDARRFSGLGPLAVWLQGAALYVGNDSGVTHLAAALGIPVVAIFGETEPERWAPRGANVRIVRAQNLDLLAVEEVERAAVRAMQR